MDRTLAFAVATRVWQAASGPITAALLIGSLTLPEQGVYYAMIGVVGLQMYVELGLLGVLVSHAGHAAAAMKDATSEGRDPLSEESGRSAAWASAAARLRDLVRVSFRWFFAGSVLFAAAALAFGAFVLRKSEASWQGPLLALVLTAAVAVGMSPGLSILEGAGYRRQVYRLRLIQAVFGSAAVWTTLALGGKFWALAIASGVQAAVSLFAVFLDQAPFFARLRDPAIGRSDFDWFREVLPVQWRVAIINLTFHVATQFFTVIVLMFHGSEAAGPLGLTVSVTSAMQMLALAWMQTTFPIVSGLHGSGRREEAGTIWRRTTVASTLLLIAACGAGWIVLIALPSFGTGIEKRFVTPTQFAALSLGIVACHATSVQFLYVLSRRARPLLVASLVSAVAMAAAVWIGGYFYSVDGVVWGYAFAGAFVYLPCHTAAYLRFRRREAI